MDATIVVVGNELLSGHTTDANGPFLAGRLRDLGHRLQRLTIVPDDRDVIREAIAQGASLAPLVFVCGGLGPTMDDVTIEAVAAFLGRGLETPEEAAEQLRRIYRIGKERGYLESEEVDEGAWRMARVPEGGTVVANDEGAAPGSVHGFDRPEDPSGQLYVLPGPPRELQSVFANLLARDLVPEGTQGVVREVHLATFEAPVAHHLDALDQACPDVAVGSYPQHGEKRVIVRLTGEEPAVEEAMVRLRKDLGALEIEPDGDTERTDR